MNLAKSRADGAESRHAEVEWYPVQGHPATPLLWLSWYASREPLTGARHAGPQGLGHQWSEQDPEDDGRICVECQSLWASPNHRVFRCLLEGNVRPRPELARKSTECRGKLLGYQAGDRPTTGVIFAQDLT